MCHLFTRSHVRSHVRYVRPSIRTCGISVARVSSPAATVASFSFSSLFFLVRGLSHVRTLTIVRSSIRLGAYNFAPLRSRLAPHSRTRHLPPRSEHCLLCLLQRIVPPSFVLLARPSALIFLTLSLLPLAFEDSPSSNRESRREKERGCRYVWCASRSIRHP